MVESENHLGNWEKYQCEPNIIACYFSVDKRDIPFTIPEVSIFSISSNKFAVKSWVSTSKKGKMGGSKPFAARVLRILLKPGDDEKN
jgi:hypothetical protein